MEMLNNIRTHKWMNMIVTGKNISIEQGMEINIRTTDMYFMCNDDEIKNKYGILKLVCLHNYNIMSTDMYGAHGWCSWDGKI